MFKFSKTPIEPMQSNGATTVKSKKMHPLFKHFIISCILCCLVFAFLLPSILSADKKIDTHYVFNIETIAELTTLKCRYHNVDVHETNGNILGVGRKNIWIEYDVIVEVGIDVNQAYMKKLPDSNIVQVYLPPAEIFGTKEDKATISKPVYELGPFTTHTTEEDWAFISDATAKLENDAKAQTIIIDQAYNRAKRIVEEYVANIGELMGENYTIEWLESPDDIPSPSTDQADTAEEQHQEDVQ